MTRLEKLTISLILACNTAACAPQHLQSAQIVDYNQGRPVYLMTGYTAPGETKSGDSLRHAKFALTDTCPDGINIVSVDERPTHAGFMQILFWSIKAECT